MEWDFYNGDMHLESNEVIAELIEQLQIKEEENGMLKRCVEVLLMKAEEMKGLLEAAQAKANRLTKLVEKQADTQAIAANNQLELVKIITELRAKGGRDE